VSADLAEQNRILRERVAQLEKALAAGVDPIMRALLEHAPAFLTVVSPAGHLLATGRTSSGFGSVVGMSVFDFTEASHHAAIRAALARVCETGAPVVYETVAFGENGERGHSYLVRAVPLREGSAVTSIVLVPADITDRVRLERSLAESEQALRLAVDAAKIGLWRWDMESNSVEWDRRVREIWGVAETPANYETYIALVPPDDRAVIQSVVREALETGVYRTFEHRLAATADAGERWVLAAGTVIKNASGKPSVLMGGVIDITEQKQLVLRMERAERVESIGQLTAGIAHNFNNLLAAIIPNVELALPEAGKGQRDGLSVALDAALQARDMIKNLVALARRRPTASGEPCDPKGVLASVEAICRTTFPREIAFTLAIDPAVGHVAMPASDLEQVLLNLCFNARDAVEQSSGSARRIDLRLDRLAAAGAGEAASVRIQVVDSGVGMTEEVRRRIFEPFFSTKPPHQGSGLGLANAAARVREAHGQLECESTPGVGTTFTLRLAEAPPLARPERAPGGSLALGRTESVLVVDDEPLVRGVLRRMLESDGYSVLEAESAAEAREVLERHGPRVGLVILDQSMPMETGVDALPSLRRRSAAPVILFTGLVPEQPPGVEAILEKPATQADLQRVIQQVLALQR
jgi:two-component system cell cycle sensor histidine kinase/response regulator CckA